MSAPYRRNRSLALSLAALVAGMVMLAYAAVPLYRLFCQVTGFGGTVQEATTLPDTMHDRTITVQLNADVAFGLPWEFQPGERSITVRVGEQRLTHYTARNLSDDITTGVSTYNVTPHKAGPYFNKVECFCFENQPLEPGKTANLPLSFFIDPDIVNDPALDDINTITLSYTFFPVKQP